MTAGYVRYVFHRKIEANDYLSKSSDRLHISQDSADSPQVGPLQKWTGRNDTVRKKGERRPSNNGATATHIMSTSNQSAHQVGQKGLRGGTSYRTGARAGAGGGRRWGRGDVSSHLLLCGRSPRSGYLSSRTPLWSTERTRATEPPDRHKSALMGRHWNDTTALTLEERDRHCQRG